MPENQYVKNWRDVSEYLHLQDESWLRLAWEFLRRNEEYQQAQLAWRNQVQLIWRNDADKSCQSGFFPTDGPIADMALDINRRFGIDTYSFDGVEKYCVHHPGTDTPPKFGRCKAYLAGSELPGTVPDKRIFVELDLTLPIEFQLKRIQKMLNEYEEIGQVKLLELLGKTTDRPFMKKRFNKRDKLRLIQHLRILDAIAVGMENKDMIPVMFSDISNEYPENKASARVRDHKDDALFFKNSGYRDLLLLL